MESNQPSWENLLKRKKKERSEINQNEKVIQFTVQGMTCVSCERRIQKALSEQQGVIKAMVHYSRSKAEVRFDSTQITQDEIFSLIKNLDYEPVFHVEAKKGNKDKPVFTKVQLVGIAIVMAAVFLILNQTGIFNQLPEVNQSMGYGVLFIIGLLTSVHCLAMCGGINLSQSISQQTQGSLTLESEKKPVKISFNQIKPGLQYNLGRLLSYTIIGGIVGSLGSVISFSQNLQGIIIIVAGILMVLMGLNMLGFFPFLKKLSPRMPRFISERTARLTKGKGPFIIGLLNGFMPCGPLQTMQIYALGTASFFSGAISMFLFAAGTLPLMIGFSAISSLLSRKFTARMMKISAMLIFFLGAGMFARGMSLSGIGFQPVIADSDIENLAALNNGIQEVESRLSSSSYEPIIVQAGVPVRWNLIAEASDLNGCNNPVTIPSLGIRKRLAIGDNWIEFTPEKAGNLTFTCWMGMITSFIKVVDDLNSVQSSDYADLLSEAEKSSSGSSCCSSGNNSGPSFSGATAEDFDLSKLLNNNDIVIANDLGNSQSATVLVGKNGFEPGVIVFEKGKPAALNYFGSELDNDNYRMIVPDYRGRMEFREGDNIVNLEPEFDFYYHNWTSKYYGFVVVVDNLDTVDFEKIKQTVKDHVPLSLSSGASGGCCGG